MAKVTLNAPLLATINGPTQTLRWRTVISGQAQAAQKPQGHKAIRRIPGWPGSPYLTSPPTWDADCKAWKTADLDYTREIRHLAAEFRKYNTKPHTSTYDAWMKQAMPHYLRGLPCNKHPLPYVAWSLRRFLYTTKGLLGERWDTDYCYPPPECQTWGLWYVNVRFRNYTLTYEGTPYPACDFALAYAHNTLFPVPQAPPYLIVKLRQIAPDNPLPGYTQELDPFQVRWDSQQHGAYWWYSILSLVGHYHWSSVACIDWKRGDDGYPTGDWAVDPARQTTVQWLDGELAWCHWPRAWPSKRPPRSHLPPGWPPDPW